RELEAVLQKTLAHMGSEAVGPWRREVLLFGTDGRGWQRRRTILAKTVLGTGRVAKGLPAGEGHGSEVRARVRAALGHGPWIAHFDGHGSRFQWQLGDGAAGVEVFDVGDLEQLAAGKNLPIVLSMTCATAPFDHPAVDSLAERLLMRPGGAVAVLGASAANVPSLEFSQALLRNLATHRRLGEAVAAAKQVPRVDQPATLYNLLGDPALELRPFELHPELAFGPSGLELRVLEPGADALALVTWLDETGERLADLRVAVEGWSTPLPRPAHSEVAAARWIHAYVWSAEAGLDGAVLLEIASPALEPGGTRRPPGSRGSWIPNREPPQR
ncbi:MAG: C25 family cysteine peptidase, partial [Holophagales bacterium]|nr:C25 family cysteine peptidase [Holophagales bacterium]